MTTDGTRSMRLAPLATRFVLIAARQALKARLSRGPAAEPDSAVVLGGIALAIAYFVPQGLVAFWVASGRGPGRGIPFFDLAWYSR
jgi:hypothetical protein